MVLWCSILYIHALKVVGALPDIEKDSSIRVREEIVNASNNEVKEKCMHKKQNWSKGRFEFEIKKIVSN